MRNPIRMDTISCRGIALATVIARMRQKNRTARATNGRPWARGIIDWVGQFKALKRDGYHFAVSLETPLARRGPHRRNPRGRVGPG